MTYYILSRHITCDVTLFNIIFGALFHMACYLKFGVLFEAPNIFDVSSMWLCR